MAMLHAWAWAWVLPSWQGADENLRYAAVQAVAHDRYGTPLVPAPRVVRGVLESAVASPVASAADLDRGLLLRPADGAMPWIVPDYRPRGFELSYELAAPLYALFAARVGSWMPVLIRWLCVLFAGATAYATYRTALAVWEERPVLALAAGAIPALLPAAAAVHGTTLPDAVANAAAAGALAVLVTLVVRGPSRRLAAWAVLLVALAVSAKQNAGYLIPLAVVVLPGVWLREAAREGRLKPVVAASLWAGVFGAALAAVVAVVKAVPAWSFGEHPLTRVFSPALWARSYLGMFDFFDPPLAVRSFFSGIGWLQVFLPRWTDHALGALGVLVVVLTGVVLGAPALRARAGLADPRRMAAATVLIVAALAVTGQALVREALSVEAGIVGNAAQGRWLFAALPAFAVVAVLALGSWWGRRGADLAATTAIATVLGAMAAWLLVGRAPDYFYVVFPDVVRESALFFGRMVAVDRGVMMASTARPEIMSSPAAAVAVFGLLGGTFAAFVGTTSALATALVGARRRPVDFEAFHDRTT